MKQGWKLRLSRRALLKAGFGGGLLATLPPKLTAAASSPAPARLEVRSRLELSQSTPQLQQTGATASVLVLVDSASGNPFGAYYAEILRLEGISDVEVQTLSGLTAAKLSGRAAVILAEAAPSAGQVSLLSNYVNNGGGLIAMRPAANLNAILGVNRLSGSLSDGYLRITDQSTGAGLFDGTMQFHGTSSRYSLAGATQVAELYSSRDASTGQPAVTVADVGQGRASMFSYDLARSIALTRQGNPASADVDTDGDGAVRSIDIYKDWIDLERSHVPQADMQVRLLTRLIEAVSRRPVPRLWYFPGTAPSVLVPTGDAHANPQSYYQRVVDELGSRGVGLTFFLAPTGPSPQILNTWKNQGFDFAPHPYVDSGYQSSYQAAFSKFVNDYGFQPRTARTHMVRWTGWSSAASIQAAAGVEMNFDSYQWGVWLNKPGGPARGYVSGSGLPMRFVSESGQILPIYQQHTSLVDEELAPGPGVSGISYADAVAISHQTIDEAVSFHTAIATQFHVDYYAWGDVNPWVLDTTDYALAAGATPLTADQWLSFVKARAATSITNINWTASILSFDVVAGGSSQTLLLPIEDSGAALISLQRNGASVSYSVLTVSGRQYAAVPAASGGYQATYQPDTVGPVISDIAVTPGSEQATVTWNTDELATSRADYGTTQSLGQQVSSGALVTSHSLGIEGLTPNTTYSYRVTSADASNNESSSETLTFQTLPPEAPLLLTINPSSNQAGTSQAVSLAGQNFVDGASVSFGSQPLANVQVVSETQILATVPASIVAGIYDVIVTNPDGQFSTLPGGYQVFAPPPSLTAVSPPVVTAGDAITLTGDGFISGATVQIGTIPAQNVSFINAEQLTAGVPASLTAGLYSVTVTNPDGLSDGLNDVLTVSPLPSVGHTTVADFTPGSLNSTAIRSGGDAGDGAVVLASTGWLEDFASGALDPARWASGTWQAGGSVVVGPGQLQVTGAWTESQEVFSQGRVTARLTFDSGAWLNFGLSRSDTIANPWFLFGVPGWDTSQVYARFNFGSTVGDVPLGGFTGAPHDFAIEYLPGQSVRFLVDGELVYERAITTMNQLAVWMSAGSTGPKLTANAIEVASFASSGTYLSSALDAGERASWAQLLIDRNLAGGTGATARARSSMDAATWSAWSPVASTFPLDLSLPEGRYLQYELALSTTNPTATPLVGAVSATYQEGEPLVVTSVVVSPNTATIAPNTTQQFTAQAFDGAGQPIPGIGITWSVVNGGGTVDQSGLFTAGAVPGSFTDTVVASASGVTGSASVTVQALAAPVVTSLDPVNTEPGAIVTIAGENFMSGATVSVGAASATPVTYVSASQLTFEVPALATGSYDVTLTNPDGQFSTLAGGLTITAPVEIVETTEADFNLGTLDGTTVTVNDDGEIRLPATFLESFDGEQLSSDWTSGNYDPAGSEIVGDGQLRVSGGWVQSATTYGPLSITARVTASASDQPFLNFGLGRAGGLDYPWYLFGNTSWNPNGIYARTNDGGFYQDSVISGVNPAEPHEYTVQRTANQIIYKVDGQTVVTHDVESWGNTTPLAFWFSAARIQHQITVDWVRIDQYLAGGTYTSSVIDAGASVAWASVGGDVTVPPGSEMTIRLRTSSDGTAWSDWSAAVAFDGNPLTLAVPDGQFIQYELTLTSDGSASPELRSITLSGHTVI